jgi:hypothetical protein
MPRINVFVPFSLSQIAARQTADNGKSIALKREMFVKLTDYADFNNAKLRVFQNRVSILPILSDSRNFTQIQAYTVKKRKK